MVPMTTLALIRYGIVLKHPGQPLLLLKQSHNPHNLLVNFNDEGLSIFSYIRIGVSVGVIFIILFYNNLIQFIILKTVCYL